MDFERRRPVRMAHHCGIGWHSSGSHEGQEKIIGVAIADGTVLWQYPWAGEDGGMQAITPLIFEGTILVASDHAGIAALKPVRHEGNWKVDLVWRTKEVSLFMSNPVLI